MNYILKLILILCASIICDANAENLSCDNEKYITRLNTLRYTTCLIQDEKGEKTIGFKYLKTNVSLEPIEIFVEKSNLYRFWFWIWDGNNTIFQADEDVFDSDTYVPKRRFYKTKTLKPGETFTDQIYFQELAKIVKDNNPKINLNRKFSLSFFISPTFLKTNETGNAFEAMMLRKAESRKRLVPETSRLGYQDLLIDWR